MPSKRVAILFENFPSDYPVNLHRDYLRILNKLMRLWDTTYFDHYMNELLLSSREYRNGFKPEVVAELLFINRLHEACVRKGIQLPPEMDWRTLPHNCYSPESFATIIRNASVETICSCLDQNISVNIRFNNGSTPLIVAAEEGRLDVAEFLVDSGANLNARNDLDYTALHWAAFHGHYDIVKLFLKNKADANIKDSTGSTPLLLAIARGHGFIAAELIAYGTHIEKSKLIDIASRKGMRDIVKILKMQPDRVRL
jgi:ankyrin repeat protein